MTPVKLDRTTQLEAFERQGFLSVPNALTADQVAAFNRGIDSYLKQYPQDWIHFDASLARARGEDDGHYPILLGRTVRGYQPGFHCQLVV